MRSEVSNKAGCGPLTHDNVCSSAFAAYAAGILDGEGFIGTSSTPSRSGRISWSLLVTITMTDREPAESIKERWSGSVTVTRAQGRKPVYRLSLRSNVARAFLIDVLPYMQIRRKIEAAVLAVAFQHQKRNTGRSGDAFYEDIQRRLAAEIRAANNGEPAA